jgi:siroheme synthase (precorrin-2 oxidase/ferrochelatase)
MLRKMPSSDKDKVHIEVHTSDKAPIRAKRVASNLESLFNGPMFAKLVRNAVEEMILEGKLEYDMTYDTLDLPDEIAKRWAARMEKRYWSRRKRSNTTT